jgi:hypothetical protein
MRFAMAFLAAFRKSQFSEKIERLKTALQKAHLPLPASQLASIMDARFEKVLRKLASAQRELAALKAEFTGSAASASGSVPKATKRPSKTTASAASSGSDSEASSDAEKPKRPANAWILFTQRVERAIRQQEAEAGVTGPAKMKTVVVKQFASHLKGLKAYEEWDDGSIIAALSSWVAPPPKASASASSAASAGSKATASSKKASSAELSEEEKEAKRQEKAAKAKATREAKKASGGLDTLSLADLRSRYEELAGKKPAASLKKAELLTEVKRLSEPTASEDELEHNGQTYMRVKNHLWLSNEDEEMEYAGVWDPKKKTITMGPEPDVDSL